LRATQIVGVRRSNDGSGKRQAQFVDADDAARVLECRDGIGGKPCLVCMRWCRRGSKRRLGPYARACPGPRASTGTGSTASTFTDANADTCPDSAADPYAGSDSSADANTRADA